ncbi:MAG: integrase family protein [Chromatiaceae bacterium]|nr:integrase family protein [Chromatiaceae bacterium]
MATTYCNFAEKTLDQWTADTLAGFAADPASIPATGEVSIADRGGKTAVPGLRLRMRFRKAGGRYALDEPPSLAFYLLRKVGGKLRNRRIGDRSVFTVEMARKVALEEARDLARGIDRIETRRQEEEDRKALGLTYREALEEHISLSDLAPATLSKYRNSLTTTFKAYADRPLVDLTPDVCRALHKTRSEVSPARADQDFRVLRLTWNTARELHLSPDGEAILPPNPVPLALNKRRAAGRSKAQWNNVPRRQSIIPEARLADWFAALEAIRQETATTGAARRFCDLLEALAVTGLRRNELARLEWSAVDLAMGTLTIPAALGKNHRALIRPITRHLEAILKRREAERHLFPDSRLIWPGRFVDSRPLNDPRDVLATVAAKTGLTVLAHDLRRVYASAAVLCDVPQLATKRLLNHLTGAAEVTEGYQILSLEALRIYAQKIEDRIIGNVDPVPGGSDRLLLEMLQELEEAEKRRLIFDLAARRMERAA